MKKTTKIEDVQLPKFKLSAYKLDNYRNEGTGREGPRWSVRLLLGALTIAMVHEDGGGGDLRWNWTPGATGTRQHDDFRAALATWIKEVIPGSSIEEYFEPESVFVEAALRGLDLMGSEAFADLEMRRRKPEPTRAPDWRILENRLSRLVHTMKLGYSECLSLGFPLNDLMTSQKIAIQRIEEWIADQEVDVDNWRLLDGALGGVNLGPWCCYNAENYAENLKLGFSTFGDVTQWKDIVPKPHVLIVYHRKPVFETELPRKERN